MGNFTGLRAKSFWKTETLDARGKVIDAAPFVPNVMTEEGLNFLLSMAFKGAAVPSPAWHVILFSQNASPSAASTYADKGVTEYGGYAETTRPLFQGGDVALQMITNADNPAMYSITETVTIYGAGLVAGSSAKGDSATVGAILLAAVKFPTAKALVNGATFRVTALVTAQDG